MKQSVKISRLIKSIDKIIKATIKEDIKIKKTNNWDYYIENNEKVLEIDTSSLLENRWHYTLWKIFATIACNIFTERPADFVIRLKEDRFWHAFALSSLEELRVKEKMMARYPWTRDLFQLAAEIDSKIITKEALLELQPHKRLLYNIRQDFYNLPFIEYDIDVDSAYWIYKKYKKDIIKVNSLDELMINFEKRLLKPYFKIFEPETSKENKEEESMDDTMNNLQEQSQKTEQEKKEIDDELSELVWEQEIKEEWVDLEYKELYDEFSHLIPRFVRKLNSVLKDNNYTRKWGAFRSWKLNTRKLYKVVADDNKLFTRTIDRNHKDYTVWLLIDCSGSMYGDKLKLAVTSAALMAEVLTKVGIKFEIVWFNQIYTVYKDINTTYNYKIKNALVDILEWSPGMWWNNDSYAVRRTIDNMLKKSQPNTERILITLSDWYPAEFWSLSAEDSKLYKKETYDDFDLKTETNRASKYAKVIGIWIQDHAVEEFYKDNIVIQNIELLPKTLLDKLKHNIKRW